VCHGVRNIFSRATMLCCLLAVLLFRFTPRDPTYMLCRRYFAATLIADMLNKGAHTPDSRLYFTIHHLFFITRHHYFAMPPFTPYHLMPTFRILQPCRSDASPTLIRQTISVTASYNETYVLWLL